METVPFARLVICFIYLPLCFNYKLVMIITLGIACAEARVTLVVCLSLNVDLKLVFD